jgi:hypothetical protein
MARIRSVLCVGCPDITYILSIQLLLTYSGIQALACLSVSLKYHLQVSVLYKFVSVTAILNTPVLDQNIKDWQPSKKFLTIHTS